MGLLSALMVREYRHAELIYRAEARAEAAYAFSEDHGKGGCIVDPATYYVWNLPRDY